MRYPLLFLFLVCFPHPVSAVSCGESTTKERMDEVCNNPYVHPDPHKEAILRFESISVAVAEEVRWARRNGAFGISNDSRLPVSECRQFFQDVVSLSNIEVLSKGEAAWGTISRGSKLDNLDPDFRQWRFNERRQVIGYVVVRWRGTESFLIRARRKCSGTFSDIASCTSLTFAHLDAHDASGPKIACSAKTIAAPYWHNWKGAVTPIELDLPDSGK